MDELISICTFCILAFLSAVNKSKDSLKHLCFMLIYAEIQQHSLLLFMLNCFKGIKKNLIMIKSTSSIIFFQKNYDNHIIVGSLLYSRNTLRELLLWFGAINETELISD